jgi:hypothetical protein
MAGSRSAFQHEAFVAVAEVRPGHAFRPVPVELMKHAAPGAGTRPFGPGALPRGHARAHARGRTAKVMVFSAASARPCESADASARGAAVGEAIRG